MRHSARIAHQLLITYYALMVEYRAEIFLWVLANVLPFINMGLWVQASRGSSLPMSPDEFKRYFLATFIIRQFTIVWVIWEFEFQVVEGRLSPLLLRPIDPVWGFVAMHLSEQLTRIPFWITIVAAFLLFNPGVAWLPTPPNLVLALLATALAFVLRFAMQYTFAMLSFWVERASAIERVSFLPYLFLSGYLAPLTVFPPSVRAFASYTPFPYLINFPAQLLINGQTSVPLAQGFATIFAWIIAFLALNRLLWRIGLRKYAGMGA